MSCRWGHLTWCLEGDFNEVNRSDRQLSEYLSQWFTEKSGESSNNQDLFCGGPMDGKDVSALQQSYTAKSLSMLSEGVSLILSQWTALQMAIQNEWGGRNSRQKSDQLFSDLVSYFTNSKEPYFIDDLEDLLEKTMLLSFNAEMEDGSIEEVAEQMMGIHEECLQGNYQFIEQLRKSNSGMQAISQSRQLIDENANDSESSDEEASEMVVDDPQPNQLMEAEDGWITITSRHNRSKRSN